MFKSQRKNGIPTHSNNIWNKYDFAICGLGKKNMLWAKIKHIKNCLIWSKQRIIRGYSAPDVWNMFEYLQLLLPDMLQDLKESRTGSPGFLGKNYTNEEGILVNDSCHEEWDKILDQMIFLWRETRVETCSRKNPYRKEYSKAHREFAKQYGDFGENLQTEEERAESRKHGYKTIHFMDEVPEYTEISAKFFEEERKLDQYRNECKDTALDILKQYFFALWD